MPALSSEVSSSEGGGPTEGGQSVYCVERDRVLALRLVAAGALELAQKQANRAGVAELHLGFARILLMENARGDIAAGWKSQFLTNLDELPDYEKPGDDSDLSRTSAPQSIPTVNPCSFAGPRRTNRA